MARVGGREIERRKKEVGMKGKEGKRRECVGGEGYIDGRGIEMI